MSKKSHNFKSTQRLKKPQSPVERCAPSVTQNDRTNKSMKKDNVNSRCSVINSMDMGQDLDESLDTATRIKITKGVNQSQDLENTLLDQHLQK